MKPDNSITDYITGREIPDIGAEQNRQEIERFLVENKGYTKQDIRVDEPVLVHIGEEPYQSVCDLLVVVDRTKLMVIRCAAGSLGSRERETLALARVMNDPPVPFAVATDGHDAVVLEAFSGRKLGAGRDAIPSREAAVQQVRNQTATSISVEAKEREKLIFRSFDSMRVNIAAR